MTTTAACGVRLKNRITCASVRVQKTRSWVVSYIALTAVITFAFQTQRRQILASPNKSSRPCMLDMWRRSIEATIHLITDHKSHSIEREMRPEIDGDKFS